MNSVEFNKLYKLLLEEKNKDIFLISFDINNLKFAFFKTKDKKVICKFNFQFLNQQQQVEIQLDPKHFKKNSKFIITDTNQVEQQYNEDKFKELFFNPFNSFLEAKEKFKQFVKSQGQIKKQHNHLKIISLDQVLNKQEYFNIDIDDITFNFNNIKSTYQDLYRADFSINESQKKFVTVIFKRISNNNFYILNIYLSDTESDINDLKKATKLTKQQFNNQYPIYFNSLNQAIKTFLNILNN